MTDSAKEDASSRMAEEMQVFDQAKAFIKPTCLFRHVLRLYAERKLAVVLLAHFTVTLIIWSKSTNEMMIAQNCVFDGCIQSLTDSSF